MESINLYTVKLVKEKSAKYGNVQGISMTEARNAVEVINRVLSLNTRANEYFGFVALSTKNTLLGVHLVSIGTLNCTSVHPREVFKAAMINNANSIICFHNHPSGDPSPSRDDVETAKRLKEAGEILGIKVLDNIIIGDGCYYSLYEHHMI